MTNGHSRYNWIYKKLTNDPNDMVGALANMQPDPAQAEDRRVARLTQKNDRLRRQLAQARAIIDVQKKTVRLARAAGGRDAERVLLMQALDQLAPEVGLAPAYAALNLNRSSVYREDARQRHLLPAMLLN